MHLCETHIRKKWIHIPDNQRLNKNIIDHQLLNYGKKMTQYIKPCGAKEINMIYSYDMSRNCTHKSANKLQITTIRRTFDGLNCALMLHKHKPFHEGHISSYYYIYHKRGILLTLKRQRQLRCNMIILIKPKY